MTTTGDRSRARWLLAAGVADSFGLSFGWTTFTLLAVMRGGLPLAGLYNAAMFLGIVLSAPAASWLTARVNARVLLGGTGAVELVLRVTTITALIAGIASSLVAGAVVAMNVMAFVAYAAMRAEVAAAEPGPRSLTRYATAIAVIEALGAAVAALLPLTVHGSINTPIVVVVTAVYGASLIPQFACARRAQVVASTPSRPRHRTRRWRSTRNSVRTRLPGRHTRHADARRPTARTIPPLIGGCAVMLVASGPGSLGVALAAELDGQVAVLPSAVAFTVGCLLAPAATQRIAQLGLSARVAWPLLGTGMLIGWLAAPWQLSGLLLAQFCSGLSLTAFQGDMDTRIAERANPERVTSALASAAAIRAIGTAIAVRCIPTLVAAPAINAFSAAALIALIAGTVILRVIKPATPAHAPAEPRAALETLGVAPPLRT